MKKKTRVFDRILTVVLGLYCLDLPGVHDPDELSEERDRHHHQQRL